MALVIIARHGETKANYKRYLQTQKINEHLNPVGVLQSRALGYKLRNQKIRLIVHSPALRAIQTADIVKDALKNQKKPLILSNANLLEFNGGELEGMSYKKINKDYAAIYDAWWGKSAEKRKEARFPGGESFQQVVTRARCFIDYLWTLQYVFYDGLALVIGHGSMNTLILSLLLGLKPEETFSVFHFENCGFAAVGFDLANSSHLPRLTFLTGQEGPKNLFSPVLK